MSASRDRRISRALLALMMMLALVWPVGIAVSKRASGLAAHAAGAIPAPGRATMAWRNGPLGGLVAKRQAMRGRHGAILLGMSTPALGVVLLLAAGVRSATARSRHRNQRTQAEARAPPTPHPA